MTVLLVVGCGGRQLPDGQPSLLPPAAFGADFMLQQSLVVERGEARARLQAVLQKRGETVTLVGLTPFGTRAFVIEHRGDDVSSTSSLPDGRDLPFPPELILRDVQRTLLPLLAGTSPMPAGVHRRRSGGEEVVERWEGGRLRERVFSAAGEALTTITYEGGMLPGEPPGRVVLESTRPPYRLLITTLSFQRL